jgi:hypothetical protein
MPRVPNTNDGTQRAPYLRTDINMGNITTLPPYSAGPKGDARAIHVALKAAGFTGIQGGDLALCRELGLGCTAGGRVNQPEEAEKLAREHQQAGYQATTMHVGWGLEDDDHVHRVVEAIIAAADKYHHPMYIETHRATITQDIWRTVQLTKHFPEIRFNGDFSHWYTGLEMVYGGIDNKLAFCAPVFERVRFLHGRIGNPGSMQVDIGDGSAPFVGHFREMWTRCCLGFLRTAQPGDYLSFNPELLPPNIYYARVFPDAKGELREECDRWHQALRYKELAKECFAEAQRRLAAG